MKISPKLHTCKSAGCGGPPVDLLNRLQIKKGHDHSLLSNVATSTCAQKRNSSQANWRSWSSTRRVLNLGGLWAAVGLGTGLVALSAATAKAASKPFGKSLVQQGMEKFRKGDVSGSVEDFNLALEADPSLRPFLWQRGLSLYYAKEFQEGATQFRDDVAVNPNDTEEAIWAFLCEARLFGAEEARQRFLVVGRDSRPVMRASYESFRQGLDPSMILEAASSSPPGGHDDFYSKLYVGLYHEAHGADDAAKKFISEAVRTPYGELSGDYMASLAKVHCQERGWGKIV